MKKILATVTAAAFVLGALTLVGCGKKKEETSTETTVTTETTVHTDSSTETMMDTTMAPMDSTR